MLVISRFDVLDADGSDFLARAEAALAAFAARPGFVRGSIGRSPDEPTSWVLTTEWDGVGSYRRALSAYDVKVWAVTLLAESRDEPSAFEVLATDRATGASDRAVDAASSYPAKKDDDLPR